MIDATTPRTHALLTRLDDWAHRGRGRAILVRAAVTLLGPVVILAGVAMLVLPGPGLVVMALGLASLALEYAWAGRLLGFMGRMLATARDITLPAGGSGRRRALGVATAGACLAATTVLTGVVTTFVGARTFL